MKRTMKESFTLIELMVVLLIVVTLASIMFTVAPIATRLSGEAKTRSLIQAISVAMENYKSSDLYGGNYLPSIPRVNFDPNDANSFKVQYQPFYMDKVTSGSANRTIWQFFDPGILAGQTRMETVAGVMYIIDAFQNPIIYRCPGKVNTGSFDLISLGADGKAGAGEAVAVITGTVSSGAAKGEIYTAIDNDEAKVTQYFGQGDDITNYTK